LHEEITQGDIKGRVKKLENFRVRQLTDKMAWNLKFKANDQDP